MKYSDAQFMAFVKDTYNDYGMTCAQITEVVAYIHKLEK